MELSNSTIIIIDVELTAKGKKKQRKKKQFTFAFATYFFLTTSLSGYRAMALGKDCSFQFGNFKPPNKCFRKN